MPSDPARLSSTQVSFRVRLAAPVAPMIQAPPLYGAPYADAFGRAYAPLAYAGRPSLVRRGAADVGSAVLAGSLAGSAALGAGAGSGAPRRKARVTAVTWTGQAMPGDLAATQLLDAVRLNTVPAPAGASVGSSLGPAIGGGGGSSVGLADQETQLLEPVPGWDEPGYGQGGGYGRGAVPRQPHGQGAGQRPGPGSRPGRAVPAGWKPSGELPEHSAAAVGEPNRHAWYPGRRVDLGLVLLPLRVLLGSLSVYAGFSKLCDPVYFDGGERGSMMRWLGSLHPWKAAQPLLDFAMAHPVGAGLGVSFTEIVVGVLSLLGLWQRLAAATTMLLSAALLVTVSWRSMPVYDSPDLIFLAAWSPLLIAGAPFASLDGRLALDAWRRFGPDAPKAVRRRVLRRGTVVATVVIGLTMLLGSTVGAAVRTGGRPNPAPAKPATDYGTPLWPAGTGGSGAPHSPPAPAAAPTGGPSPSATPSASPSAPASKSPKPHASSSKSAGAGEPTANQAPAPGGASTSGAGSAGSPTSGSGSGNRAPKPSPSSGLIGGVLGSGPPPVQLPVLGLQSSPSGRQPVV